MDINPFFLTPLTDLTGCLVNHQTYDKCGRLELDMMECLEAYGMGRGEKKCADLISDFNECYRMEKQNNRILAMRNERLKQYWAGERKKEDLFPPPPPHNAY